MTPRRRKENAVASRGSSGAWAGWVWFAAVVTMIIGTFNIFQGLAALFNDEYFVVTDAGLLVFDFTAWGWITLILGIVMVLAGFGLLSGRGWARWFTIVLAGLNAVAQAGFLSAYPIWALIIIALDIIVIYALAARWREVTTY
jgi:hypothetical protein